MRFVAYHKINLCLRVAGIAHPEHALLAKEGGGSQQFLCNDMFSDVVGHEWYAGVVECAYANDIVDAALLDGATFKPDKPVTAEELASFCVNAYKSRIINNNVGNYNKEVSCSEWFKKYIPTAAFLGYVNENFDGSHVLTKEEAAKYIDILMKNI